MGDTNEEKAFAAEREAAEKRRQEVWLKGQAFDERMQQMTRDEPRAPRPAEQRRGRR